MGNSDLAIIINGTAYYIIGRDYTNIDEAIKLAIEKHRKYQDEIVKEIQRAKQSELTKDKEGFIYETEENKNIKTIKVYELN